ncbi:hypothetical protein Pla110_41010 [Polystyrenella longa]|uniref:Planctomycete cytochrome C n=1 Tax=Polystyrenella longa TaxID=2528007 RepID=A0A518CT05_9PLAN|nr:DUF1592 domain-containing protein [Polystyrenella longa]QDU82346.1 hypothetical protein Pla110_41010 [Polystyrenella longa]
MMTTKNILSIFVGSLLLVPVQVWAQSSETPPVVKHVIQETCVDCHNSDYAEGGLDLSALTYDLSDRQRRQQWVRIHDRINQGEMPPDSDDLPAEQRNSLVQALSVTLLEADAKEVAETGRGPMRRLNRDEYQQNLRDLLSLPSLDIRDMVPEDREAFHFNKTAETLDITRVQLTAYLNATEAALMHALASGVVPPEQISFRAVGRSLFSVKATFGNREAMFFARDGKALDNKQVDETPNDENIELALFRSAHWPYYGYPAGFVAKRSGEYRVRFSARSVLQLPGYELKPATTPIPMTFRARKPSGADVSGDVRATGGLIDIQPEQASYETTVHLKEQETFEYSLLGLPVPLARNVNGGPPTYRYPPFPEGGQPGVAFQWLEIEGPLSPEEWPPKSHRVLFDELPIETSDPASHLPVQVISEQPEQDAKRLLQRFINRASREPVSEEVVSRYEGLVHQRIQEGATFTEAMLAAYKAFLCSGHILFLQEPAGADDTYAVASRLSHFLTNSRPDAQLRELAREVRLTDPEVLRAETDRLIEGKYFNRFVNNFTDYWLNLRHVNRDEPDVRLHPEYRFDSYLIESMEREPRQFFSAMIRENLSVSFLIDSDYIYANDRLASHYGLEPISGSALQQVSLPAESPYGGLLTQAAIMKVTSNGTSTSPVIRGAWIMDRLMGQPPPPPPASVPAVEPDIRGAKTIRELLALHTESESCAKCHARFDPVGLALENFDILGSWRTQYRGLEEGESVSGIDRAGHDFKYTLATSVDASGKLLDGREFQDIFALKQLLLKETRGLARNLLQQFVVYATGTPVRFSDRVEIERILDANAAENYPVRNLIHGLVQSRIFLGSAPVEVNQDE